jgi:hypothetical protein
VKYKEDGSEGADVHECAVGSGGDCTMIFDIEEGRAEEPKALR